MSNKSIVGELQAKKNDALSLLQKEESTIGHTLFTKKDKSLTKENREVYISFNTVIESLEDEKNTIISLDAELSEVKSNIVQLKSTIASKEKEVLPMYAQMGELLIKNYSPLIADIFGKTYTDVCVEDRKIAEVRQKDLVEIDDEIKPGFVSRLFNMARTGVSKTQFSMIEQKRENILSKGTKKALESDTLQALILENKLGDDTKKFYDDYSSFHAELKEIGKNLEERLQDEKTIRSSLENLGALQSTQKRLSAIDKEITTKHSEQDIFCAQIGHDYTSRYVSPDGESLVAFSKGFEEMLHSVQIYRTTILSLSRQIEIENISIRIESLVSESDRLQNKKELNCQKIENLEAENKDFNSQIKEKENEKLELENKRAQLVKEEK